MRRKQLSQSKSKKMFKKNTGVQKLNSARGFRGGIRL